LGDRIQHHITINQQGFESLAATASRELPNKVQFCSGKGRLPAEKFTEFTQFGLNFSPVHAAHWAELGEETMNQTVCETKK
jgi:hypothetical protein